MSSFQRVASSLSLQSGTELTLNDFRRLDAAVSDLLGTLSYAQSRFRLLRPFARFNSDFATTMTSLDAAQDLAASARLILNGLQPTLYFLVSGEDTGTVVSQISSGERIIELLRLGRGQFTSAEAYLSDAKDAIDRLDLGDTGSAALLDLQQIEGYWSQLSEINTVLLNAPEFLDAALGISGERNYLVLSQNNDELRPSGGYISTYGYLLVRNGRITGYGYSPTTATSPNPPSADLVSQLSIPTWWLRYAEPIYAAWDGSWYADFPSTARMSMWYYDQGNNPHSPLDGVFSIDITGFEHLLGVIGPITIPEYNIEVDASNFRSVIYDIRAYGGGDLPHKRFLVALYQEIFKEWQGATLDSTQNAQLLGALLQALQEKHIMLYFEDEQLNNAINLLGWSGAQAPAVDHDYLMVADANLGNKSNHSIIRSLTYDVDIQSSGEVNGRTTVSYDYSAHIAENDPGVNPDANGPLDYASLVQIFVPAGTTLQETTNVTTPPTVANNETNTEFVTRLYIPYDSTQRYQFSYTTPPVVESLGAYQRYRLLVQKQPGTPANALSVQIMLPPDADIVSTSPEPAADYYLERPILEFRPDLSTDQWIEVIYR
ncbi:MAG: DUF4012 domain-containing protein [Anaerolineae bacterium]|nr:DUF4012 domain-containing protein [Anaerolineae bacterium]